MLRAKSIVVVEPSAKVSAKNLSVRSTGLTGTRLLDASSDQPHRTLGAWGVPPALHRLSMPVAWSRTPPAISRPDTSLTSFTLVKVYPGSATTRATAERFGVPAGQFGGSSGVTDSVKPPRSGSPFVGAARGGDVPRDHSRQRVLDGEGHVVLAALEMVHLAHLGDGRGLRSTRHDTDLGDVVVGPDRHPDRGSQPGAVAEPHDSGLPGLVDDLAVDDRDHVGLGGRCVPTAAGRD